MFRFYTPDHKLTQVFLDKTNQAFELPYTVRQLFQRDRIQNKVLANIKDNGITKFAELKTATGAATIINEQPVFGLID